MNYTVACNWDNDLLDRIDYPDVKTVFGGLPDSFIASGRPSPMIKNLSEEDVKNYIKQVHHKGWNFDYNVNSTCMSNMEFTAEGHKKILNYIEWILSLGVDSLTVSLPFLIELIKKHFPETKIKVSTYQKVDSVAMAQRFEDLGADSIMLSEHVNRDFNLLSAIRRSVKAKLILIANVGCIYGCANMNSHANTVSHSGTKGGAYTIFSEFYHTNCVLTRIQNPVELIKTRWIRPEDVGVYEEIGIDMLKILERNASTDELAERVKAYHERSYEGNLISMLGQMFSLKSSVPAEESGEMQSGISEEARKAFKFIRTLSTASVPALFYLDNKKIPKDFLQGFMQRDCSKISCSKCNYCKSIADVSLDSALREEINTAIENLKSLRNEIVDGSALY